MALELLPAFVFEKKEEGLEKIQKGEGKFLMTFYTSIYPKEMNVPYRESEFSLMTLNVLENMQITRIDMPEKNLTEGLCRRIYIVRKTDIEEFSYYTIEIAQEGNVICRIYADRKHEIVEKAPDNGAEIETIMNLSQAEKP